MVGSAVGYLKNVFNTTAVTGPYSNSDDSGLTTNVFLTEAPHHPHNDARGVFAQVDGLIQPAPPPRFSRTGTSLNPIAGPGTHTDDVPLRWGFTADEVVALHAEGAIADGA